MHEHDRIYIPYLSQGKALIKESDVLLFRGQKWYSNIIKRFSESEYSHVGLASWHNGDYSSLAIIEFDEKGGAEENFDVIMARPSSSRNVDVYRPASSYKHYHYIPYTSIVQEHEVVLNPKAVTYIMRKLTGLPYGWKRMWWFIKRYLVGLRLFYNLEDLTSDEIEDVVYPVCSTAVAYAFSYNDYDLIKQRADEWTKPSDISMSPLLSYMFTLV